MMNIGLMMKYAPFLAGAIALVAVGCAVDAMRAPAKTETVIIPVMAEPAYALSDFINAPVSDLDALLGAPTLTRQEGDGEYRRYGLSECALIIVLYPDDMGMQRVAYVDATALVSSQAKPELDACLAAG